METRRIDLMDPVVPSGLKVAQAEANSKGRKSGQGRTLENARIEPG